MNPWSFFCDTNANQTSTVTECINILNYNLPITQLGLLVLIGTPLVIIVGFIVFNTRKQKR